MSGPAPRRNAAAGSLRATFAIPLLLALATLVGLVSALLGDGIWNAVSWVALAIPLAAIVRALRRR